MLRLSLVKAVSMISSLGIEPVSPMPWRSKSTMLIHRSNVGKVVVDNGFEPIRKYATAASSAQNRDGMEPCSELDTRDRDTRPVIVVSVVGISFVRWLYESDSLVSFVNALIVGGIDPDNEFHASDKSARFFKLVSPSGMTGQSIVRQVDTHHPHHGVEQSGWD